MGYCCCICRESISLRRKKGQNISNIATKPVVTTKCGHLFHTECLNRAFSKTGNEVWTKKECPVCKMALTVGTDLIRIFPTGNAFEEEIGPSVEDLQLQIEDYKKKILEISLYMESSFLSKRDTERVNNQLQKENEALINTKSQLMKSKSEYTARFEALLMENTDLRNTVVSLSTNLAHSQSQMDGSMQLNQMNINGPPFVRPPGIPGPHMVPFRPYGYPNNLFHQRWPAPRPHPSMGSMNIVPRPLLRANSVENLQMPLERMSRAASMNQFNHLHAPVPVFNGSNPIENNGGHNFLNGLPGPFSMESNSRNPEEKQLNLPSSNLDTTQTQETEITSSVDEFMDDLLKETNTNGNLTTNRYNSNVGQERVVVSGPGAGEMRHHANAAQQFYAKFYCEKCKAVWGSSRCFVNKSQPCRNCNIEIFPFAQSPLLTYTKPTSSP